jgi:YVTN family beta-propeller protein
MKTAFISCLLLASLLGAHAQTPRLEQTIDLPGVEGRIDHMSMDVAGKRLFVAALGNNTVEVIDLKQGKVAATIRGVSEPQGVCFVPDANVLVVANAADGRCLFYDGTTYTPLGSLSFGDDADNVRYDSLNKRVLVGYGSGAIAVINPTTWEVTATIPVGAHPESFQIDPASSRLFVNLPTTHGLSVVDLKQNKVVGGLSLGLAAGNFPMALDAANHRLFVGCRIPARLLVFNTETGGKLMTLPLHGDCDDVFYDPARKQVYASCGEGGLDVYAQADANHCALKDSVTTAPGARTSFFDGNSIYVAEPAASTSSAKILVFTLK